MFQNTVCTKRSSLRTSQWQFKPEVRNSARRRARWRLRKNSRVVVLWRFAAWEELAWQNESTPTESPQSRTEGFWYPSLGLFLCSCCLRLISTMTCSEMCRVRLTQTDSFGPQSVPFCSLRSSQLLLYSQWGSDLQCNRTQDNDISEHNHKNNKTAVCISVSLVWWLTGQTNVALTTWAPNRGKLLSSMIKMLL